MENVVKVLVQIPNDEYSNVFKNVQAIKIEIVKCEMNMQRTQSTSFSFENYSIVKLFAEI